MLVNTIFLPFCCEAEGQIFCTKNSIRISIQQQTFFNQLLM